MLTILGSPSCSASWTKRITPYDVSLETPMWRTCGRTLLRSWPLQSTRLLLCVSFDTPP